MVQVQLLGRQIWREYKSFRLEGLQTTPLAFGASHQWESQKPDSYWQERLSQSGRQRGAIVVFGAYLNGQLAGICALKTAKLKKFAHIGRVSEVYVHEKFRGQGVAKAMLRACIKEAKERHLLKLKLSVNTTQKEAVRLYEKVGFVKVGQLRQEFCIDGNYYDAWLMEKILF